MYRIDDTQGIGILENESWHSIETVVFWCYSNWKCGCLGTLDTTGLQCRHADRVELGDDMTFPGLAMHLFAPRRRSIVSFSMDLEMNESSGMGLPLENVQELRL